MAGLNLLRTFVDGGAVHPGILVITAVYDDARRTREKVRHEQEEDLARVISSVCNVAVEQVHVALRWWAVHLEQQQDVRELSVHVAHHH